MATVTVYRLHSLTLTHNGSVTDVLSPDYRVDEVPLRRGIAGRLFVTRSDARVPDWVSYLQQITARPMDLPAGESSGAVLLLKPDPRQSGGYAITWGMGRFLLRPEQIQPDVGLRAALNLLAARASGDRAWNPERLRAIRTKRVGPTTLVSQTQASRKASIEVFPVSVYADQLRQVTGTPVDVSSWGSTITGADSLHVRRPDQAEALVDLCRRIESTHRSTRYREHYAWVDNVTPVHDQQLLEAALSELIKRVRARKADVLTLSPPGLVDWDDADSFEFQSGRDTATISEPSADSFLDFADQYGLLNALSADDITTKVKLHIVDSAGERLRSWPLLKCFTTELSLKGKPYILDEGNLFLVDPGYLESLNKFIGAIPTFPTRLPATERGELEAAYNERLASILKGAILLDKKTVARPQATPVEICDVALTTGRLVHVKKGLSSSSLSHLFAQGVVSAELLHMDEGFRTGVKKILGATLTGSGARSWNKFSWLYQSPFDPSRCHVAYVILTGREGSGRPASLPFFSKVNLRLRCDDLRRMGFAYSLALVPVD